jgi:alkylglycerol monooxygenase
LAGIAAFAVLVLLFVWPGVAPGLKAPVAAYVGVIALMASQAAGRANVFRDGPATLVAGAFTFMLSDMTIALGKFANVGWPADQWTLPTYYLAQGLIAFFVLARRRQVDMTRYPSPP